MKAIRKEPNRMWILICSHGYEAFVLKERKKCAKCGHQNVHITDSMIFIHTQRVNMAKKKMKLNDPFLHAAPMELHFFIKYFFSLAWKKSLSTCYSSEMFQPSTQFVNEKLIRPAWVSIWSLTFSQTKNILLLFKEK
jgi:hypothetical protein